MMSRPVRVEPVLPPGFSRQMAAGWLVARRYGVPARMVAEATAARLAGDWRGACEAARVDVTFTLDEVRHTHGATVAEKVADDLTHLAPDLLRWHLPRRVGDGRGLLWPRLTVLLGSLWRN